MRACFLCKIYAKKTVSQIIQRAISPIYVAMVVYIEKPWIYNWSLHAMERVLRDVSVIVVLYELIIIYSKNYRNGIGSLQ